MKNKKVSAQDMHCYGEDLLAYVLYKEKGIIYENEPILKNLWGKPSLKNYPNIYFNISHSRDCIVCVVSDRYPVGIDIEKVRAFNIYAAKKVCSTQELKNIYSKEDPDREFFRYWTLKESYVKAIGKGISYPMKNVNFNISSEKKLLSNVQDCSFMLMDDIDDYITAVCYKNS
ncbi:MAG TPA: 4'-phosphopantetheinyl transferase superfamily protein [Tissierellaceae bacterium]|nr:4'-phosphopantetheinyl transferase superfamily protein [Tissierellaceae bacterium]